MAQTGSIANTELDKAISDLHRAETLQETMKKANAIIRSKKNVTERLISEAGMSEASAMKAQQPDYAGRVGFATYQLTNNNASIKRLQDRVKMLQKKVEGAKAAESGNEEKYTFDGGEIEINYPIDRVQILFPGGRTSKEMYAILRKNGYVYSPSNKAFQRKITPQAIRNAVQLMKATKVVSEPKIEKEIVTEPSQTVDINESAKKQIDFNVLEKEDNVIITPITMQAAEYFAAQLMRSKYEVYRKDISVEYYSIGKTLEDAEKNGLNFDKKTEKATELAKGIAVEQEHVETFEKLAAGKIIPAEAIVETAKEHISEDPNYYEKLEKIVPEKKLVKLNRDYNGIKSGTIGEVIKAPNMFVKEVKFGDKTITIDNSYVTKIDKVIELRFPELPNNHPLNILDPESPQYKEVFQEQRKRKVAFPEDLNYQYTVIAEDKDNYLVVQDEKLELHKKAKGADILYYQEQVPKSEMVEITKEEIFEPNTGDEFDEIIMSIIDPKDSWKGNLMKERDVKRQIYMQLTGPEKEKEIEVERIFKLYASKVEGDEIKKIGTLQDGDHIQYEFDVHKISNSFNHKLFGTIEKNPDNEYSATYMNEMYDEKVQEKDFKKFEDAEKWVLSNIKNEIKTYREDFGTLDEKKETNEVIQEIGDVTALTDAQLAKYLDMLALPTVRDVIQNPIDVKKAITKEIEKRKTDKKQLEPENNFKGVHHNYKNQYELNKAIEALLIERAGTTLYNDSSEYSSDEKNFIRKYSGYGGLDKYGTTGKGGLFEYYTPKEIIERMWALAYKYGYNNGSMLETSIGIGEFLQYAPKDIRVVGYEINEFSAKICKILYPTAEVHVQPFEKTFIGKNNWTMKDNLGSLEKFDLVIGNPPYGDFSIVESRYMSGMGERDHTKARNYVEYFIRRGLDLLKPGGLLIYIVGAQLKNGGNMFLDSGETPVKEYLAANCELLDAYRLPDSVFERTGVTSDIIVLKKS